MIPPKNTDSLTPPAAQTLWDALNNGPVELTRALVDIYSESHHEQQIADALEPVLRSIPQVEVTRRGNTLVARTARGLAERVVLAGHIDTVPPADNLPSRLVHDPDAGEDVIYGLGSVDMKSGCACYLHAFATMAQGEDLTRDITLVLYEGEEVASRYNGLNHLVSSDPDLLQGTVALLGEPSGGLIEAGCQGTIRVKVTAHGVRAHSARSWLGDNALHKLAHVLVRVDQFDAQVVDVDGLEYHEGLNAVIAESGVATNTIPDEAWAFVNFRYAPHRTAEQALDLLFEVMGAGTPDAPAEGFSLEIDDISPAATPGLDRPATASLVAATGGNVRAKFGWTDVARFTQLDIPAVNFGPGDPGLCHTKDEHCPVSQIRQVSEQLLSFLRS
ncbi:succinyl-diaminopimelate desuccinylase [Corynebacterium sp. zg254]|uniref:Succinyl-diaminopimelate desuccinylase n=1 Tax=Corynebacterium zhongnanshanii TaxID=2768834 RepID=A0ABQ6VFX9_9CORY|nr:MULTISPECIES: succinyl-diaminopimelate desuccinylase [Corynebacterium]KAB3523175.1 succinyl-diaminopimelate desuccinylase [Corynebacterium zhongnanshanii]MCR5913717.1 succinyl-diaminopimelate desuccinylase [Corynebacterium sp. zg254]